MLIAKTVNGERIEASEAERYCDKGDYICPRCENPVHTRKGKKKIDHFAHYPDQKRDCNTWEPETEEHMEMKKRAEEYFSSWSCVKKVEKEKYFDGPYPDLLVTFYSGELMAVECQHSKITEYRIKERTERLEDRGAKVLWIFDYEDPGIDYYWSFDSGEIQESDIGFSSQSVCGDGYKVVSEEIMNYLDLNESKKVVPYNEYKEIKVRFNQKKARERRRKERERKARERRKTEKEANYYRDIFEFLGGKDGKEERLLNRLMELYSVENIHDFYYVFSANKYKAYLVRRFVYFMKETTGKQRRFLLSLIEDAKEIGYVPSRKKPRLFYKPYGDGAFFLDFRNIGRKEIKPDFYFKDINEKEVRHELLSDKKYKNILKKRDIRKYSNGGENKNA